MNARPLILFLLFISFSLQAQTSGELIRDLENISNIGYPKKRVDSLYKTYNHLLFFFNSNAQLAATMKGKPAINFPLLEFKKSTWYKSNIDLLLQDTAYHKRSLGCFLAAASNDTSKRDQIESILVKGKYKDFWHANILMVLQTKQLDPLVKTIINYQQNESCAHLLEAFLKLDTQILDEFGIDSIDSKNKFVQYLAIRSLVPGKASPDKDRVLRKVVQHGPNELRGWAISVLAHFRSPEMQPLLAPYLNNPGLRRISLSAIANSASKKDQDYIASNEVNNSVDADLLNALMASSEKVSVRQGLRFLRERELPQDYIAFINSTPMLNEDAYYDEVCETLIKSTSQSKIYGLYDYFTDRMDEKTIRFLLDRLSIKNLDKMASHMIVDRLMKMESPIVEAAIPSLMKQAKVEDVILVRLLVKYNNHQYDAVLKGWMESGLMESYYYDLCASHLK